MLKGESSMDDAAACVEAFDMAQRETAKAWHTTALLSMVNPARVNDLQSAFAQGSPEQVAQCLADIAGPSYDAYAVKACIDGSKLMKMSRLVAQMLVGDLPPSVGTPAVLERLELIGARARQWIADGEVPSCAAAEDLRKVAKLIGGAPSGRLALLAPLSPALSACDVVLRAQAEDYPFPRARKL